MLARISNSIPELVVINTMKHLESLVRYAGIDSAAVGRICGTSRSWSRFEKVPVVGGAGASVQYLWKDKLAPLLRSERDTHFFLLMGWQTSRSAPTQRTWFFGLKNTWRGEVISGVKEGRGEVRWRCYQLHKTGFDRGEHSEDLSSKVMNLEHPKESSLSIKDRSWASERKLIQEGWESCHSCNDVSCS
jgi:hypothetical protein